MLFGSRQAAVIPRGAPDAFVSARLQKVRILLENPGQAGGRRGRNLASGQL